ncbi:MAG: acyltransferase [Verrucomicrobiota bacterium]
MSEKVLNQIQEGKGGFFKKYCELFVGKAGFFFFLKYELFTTLFGCLPGAFGLACRKIFYPSLFKKVGKGVVFGRSLTIRNPQSIEIGDRVILDDFAVLDAKGDEDPGIVIGNQVFISRGCIIGCKNGAIQIGHETTIGPYSTLHSVDASHISIGDCCVIAGYCYLAGGANYKFDRTDIPIVKQGWHPGKGISLGSDVWLGGSTVIVDGATVGEGCIIGANSMVNRDIPEYSIAVGSPAKAVKSRK